MFTEIVGDLFATECDYIAHGANTLGVMGAGVALQIKQVIEEYAEGVEREVIVVERG